MSYLYFNAIFSLWKIALITTIIVFICYVINIIPNIIIFRNAKVHKQQHDEFINNKNVIHERIITKYNIIDGCLFNRYRIPSYDDEIIYLFSHGNAGWIGSVAYSEICQKLSQHGSIFLYDYRGYGLSTGKPTTAGVCQDIISVWYYLTNVKNVDPKRIVFFGHSLGTSITIYLLNYLTKNNIDNSKTAILQNGFYSMERLFNDHVPYSGLLSKSVFDSAKWISEINNMTTNMSITFIHSINDFLIDKQHSIDLQSCMNHNNCDIILVQGVHNSPIYCHKIEQKIYSIYDNIVNQKLNN